MAWYKSPKYKNVHQVLIGSLLGDGSILRQGKNHTSFRYEEQHSPDQKQYLLWKNEFFKKVFDTNIRERSSYHKINKKTYLKIRLTTKSNPSLITLRKLFYPDGKKYINKEILNVLDALALAV